MNDIGHLLSFHCQLNNNAEIGKHNSQLPRFIKHIHNDREERQWNQGTLEMQGNLIHVHFSFMLTLVRKSQILLRTDLFINLA